LYKLASLIQSQRYNLMEETKQYRFSIYINQRAIKQFLEINNYPLEYMTYEKICILSFLADSFKETNTGLKKKKIKGKMYLYFSDKLICDNCIFLSIKKRTVKLRISELVGLEFVERIVINNRRYLRLSDSFTELCESNNSWLTPLQFLMKFKPNFFKSLKSEFEPHLDNFKDLTERFNDSYNIKGKEYDCDKIYYELSSYLGKCLTNRNKGMQGGAY